MTNEQPPLVTDTLIAELLNTLSDIHAKVHVTLEVQTAIIAKLNGTDPDEEREVIMTDVGELKNYFLSTLRHALAVPAPPADTLHKQ